MREELVEQRKQLISYLRSKFSSEDWHAVQDAASDIREIEAKLDILDDLELSKLEKKGLD